MFLGFTTKIVRLALDPDSMSIQQSMVVMLENCYGIYLEVKDQVDVYYLTSQVGYIQVLRWTNFSNPIKLTEILIGDHFFASQIVGSYEFTSLLVSDTEGNSQIITRRAQDQSTYDIVKISDIPKGTSASAFLQLTTENQLVYLDVSEDEVPKLFIKIKSLRRT